MIVEPILFQIDSNNLRIKTSNSSSLNIIQQVQKVLSFIQSMQTCYWC